MLLRFLSVAGALCLGSHAASMAKPHPEPTPDLQNFPLHQLNLSCAECSFSYSDCSENIHPNAYLTVELSTDKDVLLANGDVIFPTSVPMQFHAVRRWDSSREAVLIVYSLDVLPLPHQPGENLGDLYRLRLKLLDPQGRPATDNDITVGLARNSDGNLKLFQVEEDPIHHHHPQYNNYDDFDHYRLKPWYKGWKSYLTTYVHRKPEDKPEDGKHCVSETTKKHHHDGSNSRLVTTTCRGKQNDLDSWRDRSFTRLVRPVILPGLLGVAAGFVACAVGFLVGRIAVSVYFYFRGEERQAAPAERAEEGEGALSEKQRLMQIYGDAVPTHSLK